MDIEIHGLDELDNDLDVASTTIVHRLRGHTASAVDTIASTAQQHALAQWTTYGRGMAGAAGTFRGRMSRNRAEATGYVLGDDAAFYQEFGTAHHPPQPALAPAVDQHEHLWDEAVLDAGEDI